MTYVDIAPFFSWIVALRGSNMDRFSLRYLDRWIQSRRRKPLVLRGARQVGKSTLVRLFADQHKLTLNEVNLEGSSPI
jgi:predicted AAA+ superfamily ATPase